MKHLIIVGLMLASFGSYASTQTCTDFQGNKTTFENGMNGNGEYMKLNGEYYYHTGTGSDDSSIFTLDGSHRIAVHWINEGLTTVTVFGTKTPRINTYQCNGGF